MTYVVLARKWRPQQFSDMLGQEHVTQTLTNAIKASRVAHAFLFSGPRGVGKTSAARILARALCCEAEGAPTPTPCGRCRQCIEIAEGRSTDVFEIDAASHTGVDNVREIIENVRYLPSAARFKIYVIDEVHMLSTGAFNALLKTLEEPPSHVKFVLATTDLHKVPVTILSRCQRYDFRRIPLHRITERLSSILSEEGVAHDGSALSLIAREADGSMRDAQSLLEQVLAFAGGQPLTAEVIREGLGAIDSYLVEDTFDALIDRSPGRVIEMVKAVHERGLDFGRFGEALLEYVRDLLVAKYVADASVAIERPRDEIDRLKDRARRLDAVWLERTFDALAESVETLGRSAHPRFALEVALAVLAEAPSRVPIPDLMEELRRVAGLLAQGPAGSPSIPPKSSAGSSPGPRSGSVRAGGATPSSPRSKRMSPEPTGMSPEVRGGANPEASETRPEREDESPPAPRSEDRGSGRPRMSAVETPKAHAPTPHSSAQSSEAQSSEAQSSEAQSSEVQHSAARNGQAASLDESVHAAFGADPSFSAFVRLVRSRRPALAASLSQVRPLTFEVEGVELGCETGFDEAKLRDRETHQYLVELLSEFFGRPMTARISRTDPKGPGSSGPSAPKTLTEVEEAGREAIRSAKAQAARQHPAVEAVTKTLAGSIARVRVLDES